MLIAPERHERLTDEQLREIAAKAIGDETVADIAAHIVFQETFKPPTIVALLDKLAKLEAALIHARGVIGAIMSDGNCDCRKDFAIIDAALNKAAPR